MQIGQMQIKIITLKMLKITIYTDTEFRPFM